MKKKRNKKEYAKIIHANNNIIYPLLDELKKDINYDSNDFTTRNNSL